MTTKSVLLIIATVLLGVCAVLSFMAGALIPGLAFTAAALYVIPA